MISFSIYDPATGEIIAWGGGPSLSEVVVPSGLTLVETFEPCTRYSHYVQAGDVLRYSVGQAALKASQPFSGAIWSNTTMAWQDPRTLAQAQTQAWDRIKAAAEAEEFSTFVWSGDTWQCDEKSASRIRGAVLRTQLLANTRSAGLDWVKADNTVRFISNAQMGDFGNALQAHVEGVHVARQAKRAEIYATTTTAQADAVTW